MLTLRIAAKEIGQVVKDVANKYNSAPNKDPMAIGQDAIKGLMGDGGSKAKGEGVPGEGQQNTLGSKQAEPEASLPKRN